MRYTFTKSLSISFYTIILVLLHSAGAIAMDTPPAKKMVSLELDDASTYSIEKWKVKKESNTLCQCYYYQEKKNPIIVPNISKEEITLFDAALDKHIDHREPDSFCQYFNKLTPVQQRTLTIAAGQQLADGTKKLHALRLTAQLAVQLLDHTVVSQNIIKNHCFDQLSSLLMHLKSGMIVDNIHKKLIVQSPVSSYSQDNCIIQPSKKGAVLCPPKVKGLNLSNFNGKPSEYLIKGNDQKQYYVMLFAKKTGHLILQPKDIDDDIAGHVLYIAKHTGDESKNLKTIIHPSPITRASMSPDGKWLVTMSSSAFGIQHSKLMLTQLDTLSDQYLSDIVIVPQLNLSRVACFNNASTLLAYKDPKGLKLFSLQTKNVICSLELPQNIPFIYPWFPNVKYNPSPIVLAFNHDDTRLIACLENGATKNNATCMIWDISDLNNIKQLQLIHEPIQRSLDATITLSYPQQDTVAISTDYTTFFFDTHSGAFLGKTAIEKEKEEEENNIYAADCFIPHSPITCIAKNNGATSSCVKLYHHSSSDCLGNITFAQPSILAIGMTHDGRSLVTTFDDYKAITTELITDTGNNPIFELAKKMNLVDFYALIELLKAKKQTTPHTISQQLYEYIRDFFMANQSYKEIIEKHLC